MMSQFSREAKAKSDSAFFNILLHVVPIWQNRTNGYWPYVEQAAASPRTNLTGKGPVD